MRACRASVSVTGSIVSPLLFKDFIKADYVRRHAATGYHGCKQDEDGDLEETV
jgi:hypothetical protein